jgi:hypothetical protein
MRFTLTGVDSHIQRNRYLGGKAWRPDLDVKFIHLINVHEQMDIDSRYENGLASCSTCEIQPSCRGSHLFGW